MYYLLTKAILLDMDLPPVLALLFALLLCSPLIALVVFLFVGMFKFYTPKNQEKMLEEDKQLGKQVFDWNFDQFGFFLKYKSDYRKINPDKSELIFVSDIDKFEYMSNGGIATLKCKNGNKYRLWVTDTEKKTLAKFLVSQIPIWQKEIENSPKKKLSFEEKQKQINNLAESFKIPKDEHPPKDASVVGRAVAGGIIAGPAGAVVGALSAVDKNAKNRNKK